MKVNLSSKLILVVFLVSLGILLFPTITKGEASCSYISNPTCGSHYGKICCGEEDCSLVERTVCLPWQTGEIKTYCSQEACVTVFLGCNLNSSCIEPPLNLRYYDNPKYPTNPLSPEKGVSASNISLPVKLDWDDVKGWKDGWINEKGEISTCLSRSSAGGALIKGGCEKKCDEAVTKETSRWMIPVQT